MHNILKKRTIKFRNDPGSETLLVLVGICPSLSFASIFPQISVVLVNRVTGPLTGLKSGDVTALKTSNVMSFHL